MKSVDEIYQEMMAAFAGETGMEASRSSDLAVRLYAVAAQIYSLYVQADWVGRQGFPQSAEGTYLDQHAQLRGLERRPATEAEGVIRFTADTAGDAEREIPVGTVCMTAGAVRFETTEAAVLAAGETDVEVRARALEPGTAGNVAAGTILTMAVAPVGVNRCVNPAGFSGGTDREEDEALRTRILESFRRLPNGANAAFYQQGAMAFEEVAAATVLPRSRGIGTVDVVVATASGIPPAELLLRLQDYFEARREIAVDVAVRAPTLKTVNVAVKVAAEDGREAAAVRKQVEAALNGYFSGRLLGQNILRARLGEQIYGVAGVANYAIVSPAADVAVGPDELPTLNTLTVEELV